MINEELSEGLRRLLEMETLGGQKLRARNAFLAPIQADVWEQLATSAINSFIDNGKALEVLEPWQAGVIQSLTPALTGISTQVDADLTFAKMDDEEIQKLLETVLPSVLQERVALGNTFEKVAEDL